jgi:DNA-binding transcriptional MerR regulator
MARIHAVNRRSMTKTSARSKNTPAEFTIDELAQAAGTTVRNVRAYQERGLLPPPSRRGRIGIYNETHLARLRMIGPMLERGYSLANVAELIEAWEKGHDIGKLLGLEEALTSPWTDEEPQEVTKAQLTELFGTDLDPEVMAKALAMGVVKIEGDKIIVRSMKMLRAGALMVREGVPFDELLDIIGHLRTSVDRVAEELVELAVRYVFDRYGGGSLPPPEEVPRLAELVWKLRPLVIQAVDHEVASAMEKATEKFRGDKLSKIMEQLHKKD